MTHEAGPLNEWVQRCRRCCQVLVDYRHVRREPDLVEPLWTWPVGASVLVVGEFPRESVMVRRPPDCYLKSYNSIETAAPHR